MRRFKRVALLIGIEFAHGRGLLRGIYRYARPSRPWLIRASYPNERSIGEAVVWKPNGIIAHIYREDFAEALRGCGVPVVCVSNVVATPDMPTVHIDDEAVGRMAAEFLVQKGFRHFAYVGAANNLASRQRQDGFERDLKSQQARPEVHILREDPAVLHHLVVEVMADLQAWLAGLPKPVAVFAFNDEFALLLADTCLQAGIQVPQEVALLGVDDDELTCTRAFPPLSSIAISAEPMGLEAARMLDRMMRGGAPRRRAVTLAPVRVVQRQSTDVLAVSDPDVAAALQFIRQNVSEGLGVDAVAEAVGLSRRVLEKRFRKLLRRAPFEEIQRVRVERAKELLVHTDLPIPRVALAAGFQSTQQLWRHFRRATGAKPLEYRQRSRVQ